MSDRGFAYVFVAPGRAAGCCGTGVASTPGAVAASYASTRGATTHAPGGMATRATAATPANMAAACAGTRDARKSATPTGVAAAATAASARAAMAASTRAADAGAQQWQRARTQLERKRGHHASRACDGSAPEPSGKHKDTRTTSIAYAPRLGRSVAVVDAWGGSRRYACVRRYGCVTQARQTAGLCTATCGGASRSP